MAVRLADVRFKGHSSRRRASRRSGYGWPAPYYFPEFPLDNSANRKYLHPIPPGKGAARVRHEPCGGMRWTLRHALTSGVLQRTAKSCGPGAATLALRWR